MVAATGDEPVTADPPAPTTGLRIAVLGPLEATVDGGAVALGGPRQRRLLARLTVAAPRPVPNAVLVHDVWGPEPGADPRAALKTAVNRLRSALGPATITSSAAGYALDLDADRIDGTCFERRCDDAVRHADSDRERALDDVAAALALWRGPPYEEFADEDWARDESARLEAIRRRTDDLALELRLGEGADSLPVAELARLHEEHPWNERIVVLYMRALADAGRARDALDVGARFTRRMRDEVGLGSTAAVREQERAILDGVVESGSEVDGGRATPRIPPALERRPDEVPLLGRDAELATLLAAVSEPRPGGRYPVVLVQGPAGIGKTRLFKELASALAAHGTAVFYGASTTADHDPFGVVVDAIRPALGDLAAVLSGAESEVLATMSDAGHDAVADDDSIAPDLRRVEVFDATTTALRLAARGRPGVLILDDLQWVDPSSVALLRHLVAEDRLGGLRVVLGCRDGTAPERLAHLLDDLRSDGVVRDVPLARLDPATADALVRAHVRSSTAVLDPGLLARARAVGEGNPFFLAEIARDHRDRSVRTTAEPAVRAEPEASPIDLLLDRRLGRCPPEALEVLGVAAAIGVEADRTLLAAAAGMSDDELAVICRPLADAEILTATPQDGAPLTFTHALMREAMYTRIDPALRRRLHRRVLDAADATGVPLRGAERVRHAFAAVPVVDPQFAVDAALAAGAEAMRSAAHEDAVAILERARAAGEEFRIAPRTALAVLVALADAYAAARQPDAARATFAAAFVAADDVDDPVLLAEVIIGHAQFGLDLAEVDRQLERAQRVLAALPPEEHAMRLRLHCWLAWQLVYGPDPSAAAVHVDAAMAEAQRTGRTGFRAAALQLRHAYLVAVQGDLGARVEVADEIRAIRRGTTRADGVLIGGASIFEDYLELGQLDEMHAALATYRQLADRMVRPYEMWSARSIRVALALWEGELDAAPRLVSEAAALGAEFGIAVAPRAVAFQQILLAWEQDEMARYVPILAALVAGDAQGSSWRSALALAHVSHGDLASASELVPALVEQLHHETQPSVAVTLAVIGAEVAAAVGSEQLARAALPTLEARAGRIRIVPTATGSLGPVDRYRALALATVGATDAARQVADEAHRLAVARRAPLWAGRCAVDEADLLRRHGNEEERRRIPSLIAEASEIGQRHGSRLLVRRVQDLDDCAR